MERVRVVMAALLLCAAIPAQAQLNELPEAVNKALARYKLPPASFSAVVQ